MIKLKGSRDIKRVANWFGVEERFVRFPSSSGNEHIQFDNMLAYLVHNNDPSKYQYSVDDVQASFNYGEWLEEYRNKKQLSLRKLPKRIKRLIDEVTYDGKPLSEVREEIGMYDYSHNDKAFKQAREEYLQKYFVLPSTRINIYIQGKGGIGKSTLAEALARSLNPQLPDTESFYSVDNMKVALDRYDGEPTIV